MATLQKTFAVGLTIPDNEAFTALETLRRIGVGVGAVRRADVWTFDVDAAAAATLGQTIATIETVFNPNKHELVERPGSRPIAGEVWIAPHDETALPSVGGRVIPGVRGVRRRVAWQLLDEAGRIVEPAVLEHAVETFLCNPAFQKAIR
jgi:phosphoribosylformylglycinamidine (FGAM) synthase PurS component